MPTLFSFIALLIMGAMWGLQFSMLKFAALSGAGEINLLMITLTVLSIVFGVFILLRGESLHLSWRWSRFFVVIALLGYVFPLGITLFVAAHISVGLLAFIASLAPVVTIGIALVFRTEMVSPKRRMAVVLGVCSVCIILLPELQLPSQGAAFWIMMALGVPLVYGIEPIYVDVRWPDDMSSVQLIAGEAIFGALLVFPVFISQIDTLNLNAIETSTVWPLLVFVLAGVVETLLYFRLIKSTGAVFVSFGTFVSLAAGVGWGVLLFSERHPYYVWLAIGILVLALYLALNAQPTNNDNGEEN
ncbi:MAG: DMT family transporter [Acidiferrobacterales bacterium]|nr:DMT family transporter [Acidiferrobacterales bacterium]